MIPLYILGMLLRFGPQHGYQIKKLLEEQLADFTRIKLPNVYYHLEKMEAAGFVTARRDKQGTRPEKTVYQLSDKGADQFRGLLLQTLAIEYRPTFDVDAAFYFSDALEGGALTASLEGHIANLRRILGVLETHRREVLAHIPAPYETCADIIFEHHMLHYRAELAWAEQSLNRLKEAASHGKDQDH